MTYKVALSSMTRTSKALSIWQPWAWLIVNGHKNIENRTWVPRAAAPFALLIHAGKTIDYDAWDWVNERFPGIDLPRPENMPTGGIVGTVTYTGWTDASLAVDEPWFTGPYGWKLANPAPLPFVPLRGQQGLFDVTRSSSTPYQPHRPAPQAHGCHGYEAHGVMFTRCADHQPVGSRDCGPVRGACPECKSS